MRSETRTSGTAVPESTIVLEVLHGEAVDISHLGPTCARTKFADLPDKDSFTYRQNNLLWHIIHFVVVSYLFPVVA